MIAPSTHNHRSLALCLLLLSVLCFPLYGETNPTAKRPNFLWILSEDNSKHYLRLYGNQLGVTPAIEKLASNGVVFNHAFSCAPVCSVARTTLMTGILAPRGGFQYHRKSQLANLPPNVSMWPAYLQDAGYYTSNNSKKDYNVVEGKNVWNESSRKASWRKRPSPETPFFHMQTTGVSHEGTLHFSKGKMASTQTVTPTDKVEIPPYHPDTPTFRYTHAYYHDRIMAADKQVGQIVQQLEEDGLLEDTFIFYFGDHGGVLPRSKGYIYESGLHVPLVVRIPKNWRHLAPYNRGTRSDAFVSFIDFGPTLLKLAGLKVPAQLDGQPFIAPELTSTQLSDRNETFGYADRFDEKYDFCRSIRQGSLKYVRNYHPYYPDGLQNNYRYKMLAFSEWRTLFKKGNLNAVQSQFFLPRPPEQLFDLSADPHETRNLADDPAYATKVTQLRTRLTRKVKAINDLSFYPESHMVDHALQNPIKFGEEHSKEISQLVDTANLALLPFAQAKPKLTDALSDKNRWVAYWALVAASSFGKQAESLSQSIRPLLKHKDLLVQLRAAEFLGIVGANDPRPTLSRILSTTTSPDVALIALNSVVYFHDHTDYSPFDLSKVNFNTNTKGQVDRRILYLNEK